MAEKQFAGKPPRKRRGGNPFARLAAALRAHKRVGVTVVVCVAVAASAVGIMLTQQKPAAIVSEPSSTASVVSAASSGNAPIASRRADIVASKAKNSDVVGWLTVPGTTIDQAIVQTTDNDFYLTHGMDKKVDPTGYAVPFVDYRNKLDTLGRNTILYGHHMLYYSLFGQLDKKYRELDFLNQNPVIYFGTATEDRYWKIFAVYETDTNFYYIQTDFKDDNDFTSLVNQMKKQSLFNTTVDVLPTDKILTLSTCTYNGFSDGNGRFVVEARLVRPGESYTVSPATTNPDPASPHHKAS